MAMNLTNITELYHRTNSDPRTWDNPKKLRGTEASNEINWAFQNHRHQFIWSSMNADCCPRHGIHIIHILVDTAYTLYRTVDPTGYKYNGTSQTFHNGIMVPRSCKVHDLDIEVKPLRKNKHKCHDHDYVAIPMPEGSDVKAAENGVVIYASNGLKGYGNTVLVRHDGDIVTVYAHAKSLNVKRGDKVQRGQVIAQSGMTGSAKRPKLHFEVRKNATPQNPIKFLE